MASRSFSEEDFSCPVCCDIYKNPVILTCTHSICTECLDMFWNTKGSRECPVCRRRCSKEMYPVNLILKNLCETFQHVEHQREPFCTLHRSELKLYCEDDKQLVCLVCRDSKLHRNHNFSPIDEAAQECKEELRMNLKPLQQNLAKLKDVKRAYDESAEDIRIQAQNTERQIKENFEKLHKILQGEEEATISALRKEEEQKSQVMREKIEKITKDISSLSHNIRAMEEKIRSDDITLLQSYKSTMASFRGRFSLPAPEKDPETLNLGKYLSNKGVLEKMKNILEHTISLDPNTAHPQLYISPDRTSFGYSRRPQLLPDNPERFDDWVNVLGSESFGSGLHCWGVEVGECSNWDVGVVTESAMRKGEITDWPGVWYVHFGQGSYEVVESLQPRRRFAVRQKPKKIRVLLDWERGKVSFYDADNNTHLHTFRHAFTERVFPYFGSQCRQVLVKIVPLE
ncbi:nuclear factor 7, ovary-like [Engraulis encrasicolus]|uniref:nuclear factor 7, ovary-like n=1 Tax=Engraulis encrasicolus TaxID=184585 RepID=UPI002FD68C83